MYLRCTPFFVNLIDMNRIAFITSVFVFSVGFLFGQDHFLVELENRSPDVATMVRSFEGMPAIPIMANDVDGVEHYIGNYKGKNLILFFWKKESPECQRLLPIMNEIASLDDIQILSFSTNMKDDILSFREQQEIKFPVIPNSKILSDGPYGGDLGYPKIFFVDEWGIIKWVFPASEINSGIDIKKILTILHQQQLEKK